MIDRENTFDMTGSVINVAALEFIVTILNAKGEIYIKNVGRTSLLALASELIHEGIKKK
jgi:hypothetical protein